MKTTEQEYKKVILGLENQIKALNKEVDFYKSFIKFITDERENNHFNKKNEYRKNTGKLIALK
jgi:hypothetical protein